MTGGLDRASTTMRTRRKARPSPLTATMSAEYWKERVVMYCPMLAAVCGCTAWKSQVRSVLGVVALGDVLLLLELLLLVRPVPPAVLMPPELLGRLATIVSASPCWT